MTKEEHDSYAYRIKFLCRKYGVSDHEDDLIQETLGFLRTTGTLEHNFLDAMRRLLGEVRRTKSFALKSSINQNWIDLETLVNQAGDKDSKAAFNELLDSAEPALKKHERAMLVLYFEYGYELKEIGYMFGIGVPYTSQVISELVSRITHHV